jgi:hypothetical protein
MAVVTTEVGFDGQAPELYRIAVKVAELSGLTLSVTESGTEVKGDLYDLHGYLAYTCAPEQRLELWTYRAGAVRRFCEETFGNVELPMARCVRGVNEPAGTQAVYLRGYLGQEPTLLVMTTLALEALGGRPREPITDEERREYGTSITPAQLQARQRRLARQLWPTVVVGCLLLPLLIPLWVVAVLVTMPWRIWKANQLYRDYIKRRGGSDGPRRFMG